MVLLHHLLETAVLLTLSCVTGLAFSVWHYINNAPVTSLRTPLFSSWVANRIFIFPFTCYRALSDDDSHPHYVRSIGIFQFCTDNQNLIKTKEWIQSTERLLYFYFNINTGSVENIYAVTYATARELNCGERSFSVYLTVNHAQHAEIIGKTLNL